jgi:hypothetical protein
VVSAAAAVVAAAVVSAEVAVLHPAIVNTRTRAISKITIFFITFLLLCFLY